MGRGPPTGKVGTCAGRKRVGSCGLPVLPVAEHGLVIGHRLRRSFELNRMVFQIDEMEGLLEYYFFV
jgi:hypothetical protein